MVDMSRYPALVLNADYSPLSLLPVSTWSWEDAVSAVIADRVDIVAEYPAAARSPSVAIALPSVVVLRAYQDLERPAPLRRINLYVFYGGRCAYCGAKTATEEMSFDHVLPRARGGSSTYRNLALACLPCNLKKACRTPQEAGLRLRQAPRHPTIGELNRLARKMRLGHLNRTALDNLYWRAFLEE
jgi:5-methylcytosine-specific restriction endonuclease McrA